jgi:non-homologous end joining protein Ku
VVGLRRSRSIRGDVRRYREQKTDDDSAANTYEIITPRKQGKTAFVTNIQGATINVTASNVADLMDQSREGWICDDKQQKKEEKMRKYVEKMKGMRK